MRFRNRSEAGRQLAGLLGSRLPGNALVLGLPRGGVAVAAEVAKALGLPLDILVVRKLGAPGQPELGLGAIAENGAVYLDNGTIESLGLDSEEIERIAVLELQEVHRRTRAYRKGRPLPDLRHRAVVLVDDGVATGGTMRAAIRAVRELGAGRVVVAVPVGAQSTIEELQPEVDELICPMARDDLFSIGEWYDDFAQLSDDQVLGLLSPDADTRTEITTREVRLPADRLLLSGELATPRSPSGIVLFAHGSGSSRHSPRNRQVATVLQRAGMATLLFDLLTVEEDRDPERRFDLPLLANRLLAAIDWVRSQSNLRSLPLGLFGASTGAGAALIAAAKRPEAITAVVSRGGRPDLAAEALPLVRAATLLIVGGADEEVLALNRKALTQLGAPKKLIVVPGATHLFEEPGTLDEVARQAAEWFRSRFTATRALEDLTSDTPH